MTDQLSVGVIGGGSTGHHHARVYQELSAVEFVGVSDVDHEQSTETAEKHGTAAMSHESLLSAADAVSIVVSTASQYELALTAIDAGVDLLLGTPITEKPAAGRELAAAAEKADVTLQVGHRERFNPAVRTLSAIISERDLIAFDSQRLAPPSGRPTDDDTALGLMIHDADILLSVVEAPVASVSAAETAGNQYLSATVEFENGVVATLTTSRVSQQKIRTLSVTAEDCQVDVDYMAQTVQVTRHSVPEQIEANGEICYRHENIIEQPTVENGEPLTKELAAFVEAVQTDSEPIVTAADSIRALELIKQIQSATTNE